MTGIIIFVIYLSMTVFSTYFSFYKFRTDTWALQFGIWPDPDHKDLADSDEAIDRAVYSYGFRSVLLGIIAVILINLFTSGYGGVRYVLENPIYKFGVWATLLGVGLWSFIYGPFYLAKRFEMKVNFKEHFLPYWFDFPNIAAPISVLAPLIFSAVILGAREDYNFVHETVRTFSDQIPLLKLDTFWEVQQFFILIIDFAHLIANMAQKYVIAGILAFFYAIAEQKTNMGKTIIQSSIDKIKYTAWVILGIGFGTGLIILPSIYSDIYRLFNNTLSQLYPFINSSELGDQMFQLQIEVETHNLAWFMVEVFTGYGNLIAIGVIGFVWIFRKVLLSNVSISEILKLLLPQKVYEVILLLASKIGLNISTPISPE